LDTAQAQQDPGQRLFERAQKLSAEGKIDEALEIFNALLNRNFTSPELLYLVGDCLVRKGWNGTAINLLGVALQTKPDFQEAWNNLGVAFRHENFHVYARAAWDKALAIRPSVETLANMATLSADMGNPDEAIGWCEQAVALDPNHWQSYWNESLAQLTKRNWGKGWDLYEHRRKLAHFDGRPSIDAPQWNGEHVGHLYLHGEQGVGDEIMFASMIPKIMQRVDRLTVEAHKKFAGLLRQSFPEIAVVSKEAEAAGIHFDAKSGMGTPACFFRRHRDQFPGKPYLKPDPALVEHYRNELAKLGPGPYVAITWIGGVKKTRVEDRSIPLALFRPILNKYTCVSTQYTIHATEELENERINAGLPKIDDASCGADMHAQAALLCAVDAVWTVCQTAVHVAGSVGAPTFVATPSRPSWRYGIEGDDLPWYNSVRLFRQAPNEPWMPVLARMEQALDAHLARKAAA
jgi:tetratricopeptide (TPR) repeat protein